MGEPVLIEAGLPAATESEAEQAERSTSTPAAPRRVEPSDAGLQGRADPRQGRCHSIPEPRRPSDWPPHDWVLLIPTFRIHAHLICALGLGRVKYLAVVFSKPYAIRALPSAGWHSCRIKDAGGGESSRLGLAPHKAEPLGGSCHPIT